jgi:hypothetical protein
MARLKYTSDSESHREAKNIEFTIPEDLTISEFKTICRRLAGAMGYHPNTIQKAFGNDWDVDKISEREEIINILSACLTGSK